MEPTYNCPLCNSDLKHSLGNPMHPGDEKFGITLYCENTECPAQEVFGHEKNLKEAYEIIMAKYTKRQMRE